MKPMLDEGSARLFYKLLRHGPNEYTELRAFVPNKIGGPVGRVWVQSEDDFITFCKKWVETAHVYVGLNPRKVSGEGKAEHVSRIIGIPFDVDARHEKDTSSTEEEKADAYERLKKLYTFLGEKGFKPPYMDDSGNGYHLIQWVDMPIQKLEEMKARVEEYFKEVKAVFPGLDSVFDLPRILKVPGTWAMKGPNTEERPHRQAEVLAWSSTEPDHTVEDHILSLEIGVSATKEEHSDELVVEPKREQVKSRVTPKWRAEWDRKRPIAVIKPFLSSMEADDKLNNLYRAVNFKGEKLTEEDIKDKYGSRSEAEFYIIMRAFHHRLLPGEIPRFMAGCQIGKWQKETRNYQDRTIKAAWWAFRTDVSRFFSGKKFVAKWMADEIQENYMFVATGEKSKVWAYNPNNGLWEDDGVEFIHEEATTRLESSFRNIHVSETIAYIRYTNYIDATKLGSSTETLVVTNGVINLNTYELTPFDPNLFEITGIPVTYDPDAVCPKIIKFLEEVLESESFDQIIEVFGYCLLKSYPIARMIIFVGSGANGKTQLINILTNFLGTRNTSKLTLQQIANNTFLPAQLHGNLANLAADIPSTPIRYTGIIKTLTGGDGLTAQHKYFAPFDFVNYAKLVFSCNEVPPSDDTTPAWLRRPALIEFNKVFPAGDPGTILDLGNKLSTPKEQSGLLNLALTGLKRLLEKGQFTGEATMAARGETWIKESNPTQYFITHFVEEASDPFAKIEKSDLYKNYVKLCHALKRRPLPSNQFSAEIPRYLPYIDDGDYDKVVGLTKKGKPHTKKVRVWYGIQLKATELAAASAQAALHVKKSSIATMVCIPPKNEKENEIINIVRDSDHRSDNEKNDIGVEGRPPVDDASAEPHEELPDHEGLFLDAIRILEEHGGRMQQQDLWEALRVLGYNSAQASSTLRGDKRFVFRGMSVSLGQQPPEEEE